MSPLRFPLVFDSNLSNLTHSPLPPCRPSGFLPDTVTVVDSKLTVKRVDYAVNTTFICEARNKLGVGRQNLSTIVIGESSETPADIAHVRRSRTRASDTPSCQHAHTHTHTRRHEGQWHTCWDQG